MDGMETNAQFRHSAWRILLIVFALVAFILTCVFNGLASSGPNGRTDFVSRNFILFNINVFL